VSPVADLTVARLGSVPDRGFVTVHLQLQPPFDHATDALGHPLSSPFAAHEDPQVVGLAEDGLPTLLARCLVGRRSGVHGSA